MAYIRAEVLFKLYYAKVVYKQKVAVRPNAHHYEQKGEKPYIKYSCPICEQLAKKAGEKPHFYLDDENDEGGKFIRFSFPKGTKNCPCCGVNFEWNDKQNDLIKEEITYEQ